eukprot:m.147731 g.147731  ORF g.147731 m.147731 type:complete len:136 (-) comp16118_c0_seq10:1899-2306(-)
MSTHQNAALKISILDRSPPCNFFFFFPVDPCLYFHHHLTIYVVGMFLPLYIFFWFGLIVFWQLRYGKPHLFIYFMLPERCVHSVHSYFTCVDLEHLSVEVEYNKQARNHAQKGVGMHGVALFYPTTSQENMLPMT